MDYIHLFEKYYQKNMLDLIDYDDENKHMEKCDKSII